MTLACAHMNEMAKREPPAGKTLRPGEVKARATVSKDSPSGDNDLP